MLRSIDTRGYGSETDWPASSWPVYGVPRNERKRLCLRAAYRPWTLNGSCECLDHTLDGAKGTTETTYPKARSIYTEQRRPSYDRLMSTSRWSSDDLRFMGWTAIRKIILLPHL